MSQEQVYQIWKHAALISSKTNYFTHQAVEEVHHDDDDEEDECEEEEVADGRLDGEVAELELAHEHGEGLHHREVQRVEEGVVVGRVLRCRSARFEGEEIWIILQLDKLSHQKGEMEYEAYIC